MARPKKYRRIRFKPNLKYFKPANTPLHSLAKIDLRSDEFEALRLADLEGMHQEEAAKKMKISRSTFSRLIKSAHRKTAEALVRVKGLKIEGGTCGGDKIKTPRIINLTDFYFLILYMYNRI